MKSDCDIRAYSRYMDRLSAVSGIPFVNSIDEAKAGWGLRRLSHVEFEKLLDSWKEDQELRDRWRKRLSLGVEREKTQIAIDIEEVFSDVPSATELNSAGQEEAA